MTSLGAVGDAGQSVDWWFMYKVSGASKAPPKQPVDGTEYIYFDSVMAKNAQTRAHYSKNKVTDKAGALYSTLGQLYGPPAKANKNLGWFFYNDEIPGLTTANGSRGHTKGALAFDLASNTAFWLIVSTPKFPGKTSYLYPPTGEKMAQTLLCISLKDADAAQSIAKQMRVAHQPNVYAASAIPANLKSSLDDPRCQLIKNQVAAGNTPITSVIPFQSRAGLKFSSIAKNKYWLHDFYNDLVGPTLKQGLDVETWEHDPQPSSQSADKIHSIVAASQVDLTKVGEAISWPNALDHAKLAISEQLQSDVTDRRRYVCVGDINFTVPMRKRGGGTVAFLCPPLWASLDEILIEKTAPSTTAPPSSRKPSPKK